MFLAQTLFLPSCMTGSFDLTLPRPCPLLAIVTWFCDLTTQGLEASFLKQPDWRSNLQEGMSPTKQLTSSTGGAPRPLVEAADFWAGREGKTGY